MFSGSVIPRFGKLCSVHSAKLVFMQMANSRREMVLSDSSCAPCLLSAAMDSLTWIYSTSTLSKNSLFQRLTHASVIPLETVDLYLRTVGVNVMTSCFD